MKLFANAGWSRPSSRQHKSWGLRPTSATEAMEISDDYRRPCFSDPSRLMRWSHKASSHVTPWKRVGAINLFCMAVYLCSHEMRWRRNACTSSGCFST